MYWTGENATVRIVAPNYHPQNILRVKTHDVYTHKYTPEHGSHCLRNMQCYIRPAVAGAMHPCVLQTGALPNMDQMSAGNIYLRHVLARRQAPATNSANRACHELHARCDYLAMQIFKFLQNDLCSIFTFDRNAAVDAIIPLLSLGDSRDMPPTAAELWMVLHVLGLDVFTQASICGFGFRVMPGTSPTYGMSQTLTFILYKTYTLKVFDDAVAMWTPARGDRDPAHLLLLVGTWDAHRPAMETMLIHGLFGEVPEGVGFSGFSITDGGMLDQNLNQSHQSIVLRTFKRIAASDIDTYVRFRGIWREFLRGRNVPRARLAR